MKTQQFTTDGYDTATLNSMLQGESAAVESYNEVIGRIYNTTLCDLLERMRDEHKSAVCTLRGWVRNLRESPIPSSRTLGFSAAVAQIALLVGEAELLAVLERAERDGEVVYRAGLGNPDLPDDFRFLVGSQFLPQCQEHLQQLKQLSSPDRENLYVTADRSPYRIPVQSTAPK